MSSRYWFGWFMPKVFFSWRQAGDIPNDAYPNPKTLPVRGLKRLRLKKPTPPRRQVKRHF